MRVDGNTAYVGITGATGLISTYPLYVNSFSYTEGSTTGRRLPPRRSLLPLELTRHRRT